MIRLPISVARIHRPIWLPNCVGSARALRTCAARGDLEFGKCSKEGAKSLQRPSIDSVAQDLRSRSRPTSLCVQCADVLASMDAGSSHRCQIAGSL